MSSSRLSIIIPTLNAQSDLPSCLSALTIGLTEGILKEVVIVDGGSTDHTLALAGSAGCRVITSPVKSRGGQLKLGAQNAKGDWLLFLHADTVLDHDWARAVSSHFDYPHSAACFTLQYDSPTPEARWLEKRVRLRNKLFGLPYGDQGLLIHRDLYDEIGGYLDIRLMEDVDIVRKLGKSRIRMLNSRAVTSADKYERDGWRKRAWRNAFLLARYYFGADPNKIADIYK
jgi:rSAM/selenodomain-associated transferase 2